MLKMIIAGALALGLSTACADAHDGDYAMWIHDDERSGVTHVLFKNRENGRMAAARRLDEDADFEVFDAARALAHFERVRDRGAGANVSIRAEGEFDEDFEARVRESVKEKGFTMQFSDDEMTIRFGDGFILEAKDEEAFIKIGDEDGLIIEAREDGDEDDALVIIGGLDEDDVEDAIDDLDDAPRSVRRALKRELGL